MLRLSLQQRFRRRFTESFLDHSSLRWWSFRFDGSHTPLKVNDEFCDCRSFTAITIIEDKPRDVTWEFGFKRLGCYAKTRRFGSVLELLPRCVFL
jgi:hypothetical protein